MSPAERLALALGRERLAADALLSLHARFVLGLVMREELDAPALRYAMARQATEAEARKLWTRQSA